ncbi:MAG: amidase, partial [Proteobacteria bacterium]|nr:amidase [Pseudomonadota bacterium]
MSDLHFLTIAEASALIRDRKVSPVELTTAIINRVKRLDSTLNSYLLLLEEQALADARRAEAEIAGGGWKGPLHGIPIGLKDIYNTAGIVTTGHSALFKDHVPAEDAFTVTKLKQAGAVITGKLATWEFAIGGTSFDLPWPPARNPWDI